MREPAKYVFLSYRSTNRDRVLLFYNYLQSKGFDPWLDQFKIGQGVKWTATIDDGLVNSHTIIAFLTQDALLSRNVVNEWHWALEHKRRLIFVQLEPVKWLYPEFRDVPLINFTPAYFSEDPSTARLIEDQLQIRLIEWMSGKADSISTLTNKLIQSYEQLNTDDEAKPERQYSLTLRKQMLDVADNSLELFRITRGLQTASIGLQFSVHRNPNFSAILKEEYSKSAQQVIGNLFEDSGQHLAITGVNGSGKTYVLLHLIEHLWDQARFDDTKPIPVVIPAMFLIEKHGKNLAHVLSRAIMEFCNFAGHSVDYGDVLKGIETRNIVCFIDGISELGRGRLNDTFLRWLSDYASQYSIGVTCNIEVFEKFLSELPFHEVRIKSLTNAQIEDFVRDNYRLENLRRAIFSSTTLLQLAQQPYWLKGMQHAFQDNSRSFSSDPSYYSLDWLTDIEKIDEQRNKIVESWVLASLKEAKDPRRLISVMKIIARDNVASEELNNDNILQRRIYFGLPVSTKLIDPLWLRRSFQVISILSFAILASVLGSFGLLILFWLLRVSWAVSSQWIFYIVVGSLASGLLTALISLGFYKLIREEIKNNGLDEEKNDNPNFLSRMITLADPMTTQETLDHAGFETYSDGFHGYNVREDVMYNAIIFVTFMVGIFMARLFLGYSFVSSPTFLQINLIISSIGATAMLIYSLVNSKQDGVNIFGNTVLFVVIFSLIFVFIGWLGTLIATPIVSLMGIALIILPTIWKLILVSKRRRYIVEFTDYTTPLIFSIIGLDVIVAIILGPTWFLRTWLLKWLPGWWQRKLTKFFLIGRGSLPEDEIAYTWPAQLYGWLNRTGLGVQFSSTTLIKYFNELTDEEVEHILHQIVWKNYR